jgi:crotonobetainyl-CoA:carnitine CoA-transferase CaiB-like acyl-CoA transferase
MRNVEALEQHIAAWSRTLTAAELLGVLQSIGVPSAKVTRVSELVQHPQLAHRGQIIDMPHTKAGTVPMQGFAVHFGDTPMRLHHPPPLLGQHTDEVLSQWLALSPGQIADLRAAGTV